MPLVRLSQEFRSEEADGAGATGNKRQPTVKRGSWRMSTSLGLKSVRSIWTIGGGSTGRLSLSPAPQARAAIGCWRMCRW